MMRSSPHRFVGVLERVGQRPAECDNGVELAVGVARGVTDVKQLTALDVLLGIRAGQARRIERKLHLGDIGDYDPRIERRQLQRETAGPCPDLQDALPAS